MEENKKEKIYIKILYIVILIVCLALISFVIPIVINESYKNGKGYITVWTGADVLSFYGALIGAVGTIVLGIVAWKQNVRLLNIEERTFVAESACTAIVNSVIVKKINQNACNLYLHLEQVVSTEEAKLSNYCTSIEFEFRLKMLNNIPILVHISDLMILSTVCEEKNSRLNMLSAKVLKVDYSRIAIGESDCRFNCTILLSKAEKEKLLESILRKNSEMLMEISYALLSDKMVASNYKCRVSLKRAKKKSDTSFIIDSQKQPICFWYGNEIVDKRDMMIKTIGEE